jgi:hypothetical protein
VPPSASSAGSLLQRASLKVGRAPRRWSMLSGRKHSPRIEGGGACVRPACLHATSVAAPSGSYGLQMKHFLTRDSVRGRTTVVCGDPAEAILHLARRPPLARV